MFPGFFDRFFSPGFRVKRFDASIDISFKDPRFHLRVAAMPCFRVTIVYLPQSMGLVVLPAQAIIRAQWAFGQPF
jgi:hypothetical protein